MAEFIVQAATIYAAVGAVIAVVFLLWGIDRVDPAAHGSHAVRPLLFPGLLLLWPYVVIRWLALERQRP